MAERYVVAPDVYETKGFIHAVRANDVVYTSGTVAMDRSGKVVGQGNVVAQTVKVCENLDAILRAAGATWRDVVKINSYVARSEHPWHWLQHAGETLERYLPAGQCAGTVVATDLLNPDFLLEVELIAYPGIPKHYVAGVPNAYGGPRWAHGVKVGEMVYASGQQALRAPSAGRPGASNGDPVPADGDFFAQTSAVYKHHDAILKAAGCGWDQLVKINQYISRQDWAVVDQMRKARSPYLPAGQYLSTSVVTDLDHPESGIAVELDASLRSKQFINAPEVWSNPGGPHAIRIGDTTYVHAQVARDLSGKTLFPDDITGQAETTYKNLDVVLKAADLDWGDVVHIRSYLKHRQDITTVRRVRDKWLPSGRYTSTSVVTRFLDPELLLEVECIAMPG